MQPPRPAELAAPPHWRAVELLSDLHLQPAEPATFQALARRLRASDADAFFLLGDIFEAWPGDDVLGEPGFEADCAALLREAARHKPVHLLHGNRDFLLGEAFARATGVRLLPDPTVLAFGPRRWLLSHGDALCLGDTDYLAFRAQVRQPDWQEAFLARPLAERQAIARSLRSESEARKRSGMTYADVDTAEALAWLAAAGADTLVHGHTHRPGEHRLDPAGRRRLVLSDWDPAARPPRGDVLRLDAAGHASRLPVA